MIGNKKNTVKQIFSKFLPINFNLFVSFTMEHKNIDEYNIYNKCSIYSEDNIYVEDNVYGEDIIFNRSHSSKNIHKGNIIEKEIREINGIKEINGSEEIEVKKEINEENEIKNKNTNERNTDEFKSNFNEIVNEAIHKAIRDFKYIPISGKTINGVYYQKYMPNLYNEDSKYLFEEIKDDKIKKKIYTYNPIY